MDVEKMASAVLDAAHLKDGVQRVVLNHPTAPLRAPSRPSR